MSEGKFAIRRTGTIGLEIVGPNGLVIAWAADDVIGALLVDLLNKNRASYFEAKENDECLFIAKGDRSDLRSV